MFKNVRELKVNIVVFKQHTDETRSMTRSMPLYHHFFGLCEGQKVIELGVQHITHIE